MYDEEQEMKNELDSRIHFNQQRLEIEIRLKNEK